MSVGLITITVYQLFNLRYIALIEAFRISLFYVTAELNFLVYTQNLIEVVLNIISVIKYSV